MVPLPAPAIAELAGSMREGVDHAGLGQEAERAVDGREAELLAARAKPVVELLGGDVVLLAHQLGEHPHALARGADAGLGKDGGCALLRRFGHVAMLAILVVTRIVLILAAAAVVLFFAGCGGDASSAPDGRAQVVVGFYPLAFAAAEIGGDRVDVTNLTPPGAEPHDVELSVRDVEEVRDADLVLYLGQGFQPALEDAAEGSDAAIDLLDGLELREGEGGEDALDPHVWLDPVRFAQVAERIGTELEGEAPARQLASQLRELDGEYRAGLEDCDRNELVTAHDAFGYLGDRYGLEMIPITGISPEAEPSPQDLAEISDLVTERGVTTVFVEPLLSPEIGETVAREAGAETAVLNPLEGLTEEELERGENYFTVMRANLDALREGLGCR
jgi:zinc transport system substrate-binding protein